MDGFLCLDFSSLFCRKFKAVLAVLWITGTLFGATAAISGSSFLDSLSDTDFVFSVTFPGLAAVLLIPVLISIFAITVSKKWLLYSMAFLKAFLFAYIWICFTVICDASGWLLRALFMFGDTMTLPLLWWIWLLADTPKHDFLSLKFLCASVSVFAIACVDYAIIVPFCAQLI